MYNSVAIVVTYNKKEYLKENIEALLKQSIQEFDIYIIDNASTDGTYNYVEDIVLENSRIEYINTGANLGGCGAFSFGIKKAYYAGYSNIWTLDDDVVPKQTAFEELLNVAKENPNYGFLASTILWTNAEWNQMNLLRKKETKGWHEFENYHNINELVKIDSASFVSLMINSQAVKTEGLPIKEFFIWGDDREYTDRIAKKYDCYYVSKSIAIHKSEENIGSNIATDQYDRIDRYQYTFRNEYYIARRNGTKREYRINVRGNILLVLRTSKSHKIKRIKSIIIGRIKGWFFHPEIEYVKEKNIID